MERRFKGRSDINHCSFVWSWWQIYEVNVALSLKSWPIPMALIEFISFKLWFIETWMCSRGLCTVIHLLSFAVVCSSIFPFLTILPVYVSLLFFFYFIFEFWLLLFWQFLSYWRFLSKVFCCRFIYYFVTFSSSLDFLRHLHSTFVCGILKYFCFWISHISAERFFIFQYNLEAFLKMIFRFGPGRSYEGNMYRILTNTGR